MQILKMNVSLVEKISTRVDVSISQKVEQTEQLDNRPIGGQSKQAREGERERGGEREGERGERETDRQRQRERRKIEVEEEWKDEEI